MLWSLFASEKVFANILQRIPVLQQHWATYKLCLLFRFTLTSDLLPFVIWPTYFKWLFKRELMINICESFFNIPWNRNRHCIFVVWLYYNNINRLFYLVQYLFFLLVKTVTGLFFIYGWISVANSSQLIVSYDSIFTHETRVTRSCMDKPQDHTPPLSLFPIWHHF